MDGPLPVIGETFTIAPETLHEIRRINVYQPPGCTEFPNRRVSVLYVPEEG